MNKIFITISDSKWYVPWKIKKFIYTIHILKMNFIRIFYIK